MVFVLDDRDFDFLLFFLSALLGKKRSFRVEKEYGDSGAGMILSQMMTSESRGLSLAGEDAGYDARTYTKSCLVFQLKRGEKSMSWEQHLVF